MILKIVREEDDPICCRASIGGNDEIGYYLVFRNNPRDVIKAIKNMLEFIESDISEVLNMKIHDKRINQRK